MESQVEFNRKKNAEQDKKIDTLSSQITQILEQSPAGFLPRVFYGLSRGAQTYRFIADKVFTIEGLSGNVGDAYELDSMSEPKEYINAVAIQQNSNQIKILIQGDYTVLTTEFKLVNTRTGQSMDVSLTDALSLQDASYLGQYPANENKEKQITVLHDLEDNRDNEVFASVDYSGDGTYNWVHIGGYFNGTDGAGVFGVTNATIANVLTIARVGDILLAGEAFTYETIDFAIGDLKEIKTLKPLSVEAKGNIRGAQGIQGIQGLPGKDGTNGLTPTIQEGYWWIGDVNTGVKAAGVDGTNGQDGKAFAVQSGLYSAPANVGKTGNTDPEGNALTTLPTLPQTDISGKGFVVYDPLTTPLKPYYDLYWANNGDTEWTIIHPFNGLNGKDGTNGLTPYIKDNNWWIGSTNTGVPATGSQGAQGVGVVTVENTGYTDGEDFTVTHCEATLTNGNKETFDVQAKHGKQGVQGATGATGATPNISVSATKLPANSNPTATRTGTNKNPIITFGIPSSGETPHITITAPASATSGTITAEQLAVLQSSNESYILFNNEKYDMQDPEHESGFLVFSHVGHDSTNNFFVKCITVTISTRGWVLAGTPIPKQLYSHDINLTGKYSDTTDKNISVYIKLICSRKEPFTLAELNSYLWELVGHDYNNYISCSGTITSGLSTIGVITAFRAYGDRIGVLGALFDTTFALESRITNLYRDNVFAL